MATGEVPEILTSAVGSAGMDMTDMMQTPKQLSTNDMTMLLSASTPELASPSSNSSILSSGNTTSNNTVLGTHTMISTSTGEYTIVNNTGAITSSGVNVQKENNTVTQNLVQNVNNQPGQLAQTFYVSGAQGQQQILSAVPVNSQSLLANSGGKRVILQPANASMNAIVQNLVQGQSLQGVKRPATGSQLVTKFIIQKNSAGGQQPIQVVQQKPGNLAPMSTSQLTTQANTSAQPIVQKIAMSPVKTSVQNVQPGSGASPAQIRLIPVSSVSGNSPQKMIPLTIPKNQNIQFGGRTVAQVASSDGRTLTLTPSKLVLQRQQHQQQQTNNAKTVQQLLNNGGNVRLPVSSTSGLHQGLQPYQGQKMNYLRLVNTATSGQTIVNPVSLIQSIAKPTVPLTTSVTTTSSPQQQQQQQQPQQQRQQQQQQMKIHIPLQNPIGQPQLLTGQKLSQAQTTTLQRILLPGGTAGTILRTTAPQQVRPGLVQQNSAPTTSALLQGATNVQIQLRPKPRPVVVPSNISQASTVTLQDNAPLLPSTSSGPTSSQSGQLPPGFTLVPATYLNSIVNQAVNRDTVTIKKEPLSGNVDIAAINNPEYQENGISEAPGTRPRKPCNCTKSQCLKLYCDCFANGEFCNGCNCNNCYNNIEHEDDRSRAIRSCLDRNPLAFHPKIGKNASTTDGDRRHTKGCNCKKSGCLKNYCECFEARINCSDMCRCVGCKNFEDAMERKDLLTGLAAAETRAQNERQAKKVTPTPSNKLLNSRLPYTFITSEVGEATCACLLAQSEDCEREHHSPAMQERLILQEFGRCLMQIIESANRTKSIQDALG